MIQVWLCAACRSEASDDLVALEVEIDPMIGAPPFRAPRESKGQPRVIRV